MDLKEWQPILATVAAAFSAAAAVFSAIAATRSANTARETRKAAIEASRRATLLEIASVASSVVLETSKVEAVANSYERAYGHAATHAGAFGGSQHQNERVYVQSCRDEAIAARKKAELFSNGATTLLHAPSDDVDRVLLQQRALFKTIEAMRIALDEKLKNTRLDIQGHLNRQVASFAGARQ